MTNLERARKTIDVPMLNFEFPKKIPLTIRLGDILDKVVAAKYSVADVWYERIREMKNPNLAFGLASADGKIHEWGSVLKAESICPTITRCDYKMPRMVYLEQN